jgi:hypothetical protein
MTRMYMEVFIGLGHSDQEIRPKPFNIFFHNKDPIRPILLHRFVYVLQMATYLLHPEIPFI